jgi:hypothetical protein
MTAPRVYWAYVGHIREAAARAQEFVAGMSYDQFADDPRTTYATRRIICIVATGVSSCRSGESGPCGIKSFMFFETVFSLVPPVAFISSMVYDAGRGRLSRHVTTALP